AQARSTLLPAAGVASVPLDVKSGRPVVDVLINGKGPYRFIVDTGASHSVIDSALAKELGLPVLGETHMGDPSNPYAIRAPRVRFAGPLQLVGMARTVNSTFNISGGALDGALEIADQKYDRPYLSVQGIMPRVNVGGRLLQDYALTFDQRALLVDFERKQT